MKYDLEQRTALFSANLIKFCGAISRYSHLTSLVDQLIRSGTSIGANYCEAIGASSKKDFRNKIFICKKESIETRYWLRLLAKADEKLTQECESLIDEANQFSLIFSKIANSSK